MSASGRGILLLVVAFVIGVAILRSTGSGGGSASGDDADSQTATTRAESTTTVPSVATTLPARPAAEVKVLPVNSSGIAGVGGKTGDELRTAGYANTLAAVNSTSDSPTATSSVEFTPGAEADAVAVASVLRLPATVVKPLEAPPVDDTRGAEVVVLIGGDLAAIVGASAAATTTTEG
ncbi:MAG TPA: LytR C-terminal domain-containing protein [Acidimicrobiales bacterium]|nr:LytR C-terminal domain-containing protein [Acidimicrobiales bacterium]